ncbi:MAG: redoxin domain-containing protein [Pseudomonadales bacterium]
MTQLVQLQKSLPELREAGYEVFAISNDTVERLADFAEQHGITYSLLSDEDSTVIRAFGIMNTLIRPDEGMDNHYYGIPYPGTYITDQAGIVVDKDFHQHHSRRLSGRGLLHRVLGTLPEQHADTPEVISESNEVTLTTSLVDPTIMLEVISVLVCRLHIAAGRHIYAPGAPEAFTPASLQFHGEGIRFGEPAWPQPQQLNMTDLNIQVPVYEQEVTISVPVTATSSLIHLGHDLEQSSAKITIVCTYQACDELSCGLPATIESTLTVPLEKLVTQVAVKKRVEQK